MRKNEMKHLKAVRIQGLQISFQSHFAMICLNEKILKWKIREAEGDMKTKEQRMGWVESNGNWHIVGQHYSKSKQGKTNSFKIVAR